jgi:hypothetical protein
MYLKRSVIDKSKLSLRILGQVLKGVIHGRSHNISVFITCDLFFIHHVRVTRTAFELVLHGDDSVEIKPETRTETGNRIEIVSTIFELISTSFVKSRFGHVDVALEFPGGGAKIVSTSLGADANIFSHVSNIAVKLIRVRSHNKTIGIFCDTEGISFGIGLVGIKLFTARVMSLLLRCKLTRIQASLVLSWVRLIQFVNDDITIEVSCLTEFSTDFRSSSGNSSLNSSQG